MLDISPRDRILRMLIERGALSVEGEARARRAADRSGESLISTLGRLGLASEEALADAISTVMALPRVSGPALVSAPTPNPEISISYLKRIRALPLNDANSEVVLLAMADATDEGAMKAMELYFGKPISVLVALATDMDSVLERFKSADQGSTLSSEESKFDDYLLGGQSEVDRLREAASDAPVIRYVNSMLARAVDERVSDIHIEPTAEGLAVRYRIDGRLRYHEPAPAAALRDAILSRIKLMASLDIAERRLPQDGRISYAVRGEDVDFRVATAPTSFGESVVIRVLDRAQIKLDFLDLGFDEISSAAMRKAFVRPNGMVLVTGPTGSGKTTTLYAALSALNAPEFKLMTVEDPIEYHLPGIQQVQVNPAIGLNFARALRSFLRHNPNVVMVGEIRDRETADVAVQVALTGHLLLSTLHTNDAASGIARLLDIGVDDYLIASTCNAIIAQRLVRTLCPTCKQLRRLSPEERARYNLPENLEFVCKPVGCVKCGQSGFAGRTTIAEILHFSDSIRDLVLSRAPSSHITEQARKEGMRLMFENGLAKVSAGLTTTEEVLGAVRLI